MADKTDPDAHWSKPNPADGGEDLPPWAHGSPDGGTDGGDPYGTGGWTDPMTDPQPGPNDPIDPFPSTRK